MKIESTFDELLLNFLYIFLLGKTQRLKVILEEMNENRAKRKDFEIQELNYKHPKFDLGQ